MKYNKSQAGYKTNAKMRQCKNCWHYMGKEMCHIVQGKILSNSTCIFFRANNKNQ